jgi:thiol-disulfide isomerase/thioredoxin
MNRISEKCKVNPVSILYFYSNEGECGDCEREGYVLTHLQEKYPQLRIYAFDYHLPLSAVKTLIAIKKVKNELPALVIKDKQYYGFQSVEDIEKAIPALATLASSTVTKIK